MAFFRSLQQSLPSVTSILDSVSSTVDDLATAMSDVTYQVSDQLTEQVTTIINKVQAEEDERARKEEEERAKKEEEEAAAYREEKRSRRKKRGYRGPEDSGGDNSTGSTNSTEEERARKEEEERMMKEEEERTKKEEEEAAAYQEEKRSCRKKRGYRGPEDSGGDYSMGYAHSTEAERARKEEEEQAWKEEEERAKKEEEEAEAYQEEKRSRRKKRGYRGPEDSGGDYSMGYAHSTEAERARKEEEERAKKEEGQECSYPTSKGGSRRNREQSCNGSASPSEDTPRRRSHQDAREEEPGDVETSSSPQHQRTRKNRDGQCGERANGLHHSNSQEEPQEETATQESTSPDTTRAAAKKKKKKGEPDIEEEESPEKAESTSKSETKKKKKGQASVEEEECPAEEGTPRAATKKKKGKAKSEEEESSAKEQGNDSEQEPSSQKPGKRGKSSAVEKREEKGKSRRGSSREEERPRKSSKKDRSCPDRGSSESEDERPKRPDQRARGWDSSHKHTAENEGYSSEASNGQANSVQRVRCSSPMNELQPPPYQDEDAARRKSRGHPGSGGGSGSEGSGDPDDTESYLNKGYEEDAPSDSTAVLGPEDGSLPTGYEPEALGKYGTLDVAFEYDSGEQRLAVTVTAATDIPALKTTGNIAWQVHLVLLPTKKQRAKTGVQKGPCPVFTETFRFSRVEQDTLADYAVRFRLYSVRRMKKEKVLGEKVLYLTKLNLQGKMALPVTLEPGSAVTGCGSMVSVSRSAGAVSYRSTGDSSTPEILLGLLYNSTTGRLSAEVIKGSHFKNNATDNPPNTYVKLTMLDSKGKQMSKCKTSVCRGQPSPTYKETFVFQVALFQLSEVTLQVSVHSRRSSVKRRERVGWVSLGLSSTGEEQEEHWAQMKEAEGQQVCQWHTLLDS